jgi:hypothetical protein
MLVNSWQEVCFVYGIMLAAFWLDAVKVKLAAVEQLECYQAVLDVSYRLPNDTTTLLAIEVAIGSMTAHS